MGWTGLSVSLVRDVHATREASAVGLEMFNEIGQWRETPINAIQRQQAKTRDVNNMQPWVRAPLTAIWQMKRNPAAAAVTKTNQNRATPT